MPYDDPDRSHVPLYRNQCSQRNLVDIHIAEGHAVESQQLRWKFIFNFKIHLKAILALSATFATMLVDFLILSRVLQAAIVVVSIFECF